MFKGCFYIALKMNFATHPSQQFYVVIKTYFLSSGNLNSGTS